MRGMLLWVLQGVDVVINVGVDDIDVPLCMEGVYSLADRFLPRLLSVLFPIHFPLHSLYLR
jgi:hypothetical protein